MDEEKVIQNAASSVRKKKKKKKKKNRKDNEDESTQRANTKLTNLETEDAASSTAPIYSSPSLGNAGENFFSQYTDVETNKSTDIQVDEFPAEDAIKPTINDSISKVKVEEKAPEKKNTTEKEESDKEGENKRQKSKSSLPKEVRSSSAGSVQPKKKKATSAGHGGYYISNLISDKGSSDTKAVKREKESTAVPDDLKTFTADRQLLHRETRERNNLLKVTTMMYQLGLDILRKLFMEIHPNWSNKPKDAKSLDRGKMTLKHRELVRFNTGNINDWDVSLMTTVLLYSKECAKEIRLKPGYEDAIRTVKEQKNQLISHKTSEKMTDPEFNKSWTTISKSLRTIGATSEDIDKLLKSDTLENGKFYYDRFLEEVANSSAVQSEMKSMHTTMQEMSKKIEDLPSMVADELWKNSPSNPSIPTNENLPQSDFEPEQWDNWIQFCKDVKKFDHQKNNYILLTDSLSPENLENFSILRSVPWKVVVDFDPSSEEKGMYRDFTSKEGKNSLIKMITPDEIGRHYASITDLAQYIDPHKTHWLFVKGREGDSAACVGESETVENWKTSSLNHINSFLRCFSDPEKLDKHKPVICVILPFHKETVPFVKATLKKLLDNFHEFPLKLVGVEHENIVEIKKNKRFDKMSLTHLSPAQLHKGLDGLLQISHGKQYRIPTSQSQMFTSLTPHQYLYLKEYLDVLYEGCQELPKLEEDKEKVNQILFEHKESFLSGNWISFKSLYDNHDAKRELSAHVRNHIERLLNQTALTHSVIVEIRHLPGTGGTTIARRVLWDLHKHYPCAIAKLARLEDYKNDIDDDLDFINTLADRIGDLQESSQTNPVILLDGNHSRMETLSTKLLRALDKNGKKAVLLSCLHGTEADLEKSIDKSVDLEATSSDVHKSFSVHVNLEDSVADLNEFKLKYKDYLSKINTDLCRVFHFPLMAMLRGLPGFSSKLKQIIEESFDGMHILEKKIAVLVAFIQHYASKGTPASLIYKIFEKYVSEGADQECSPYSQVNQHITEQLLNLMVPSNTHETYTFQHPLIAALVLERHYESQNCDIFTLTNEFLEYPIFKDRHFALLMSDLFIRNRSSRKTRNSILFEDLGKKSFEDAAKLLRKYAENTGNAINFGNAARFYTNHDPPSFKDAKELMTEAFKCDNAKSKKKIISDMKGGILQSELKFMVEKGEISSLRDLEKRASEALTSFKDARTSPPSYPSPLTGEVKIWLSCIQWITKNECDGDTDNAFQYMNSNEVPAFFSTCINDSFHLLDVVDRIIEDEPNLPEPEETRRLSNSLRLNLLSIVHRGKNQLKGKGFRKFKKECEELCNIYKFPKRCSEIELKRLKVNYIWHSVEGQIETMNPSDIEYLLNLLEHLVFTADAKTRGSANKLMKVSLQITNPKKQYSLEKGLMVTEQWLNESDIHPMPYFYKMMIAFLKILNGNSLLDKEPYQDALKNCREKSQNHCRRFMPTHYLKKHGEGMNRLITKRALLSGEKTYSENLNDFWSTQSRKKLLECKGRIRIRPNSQNALGRRKQLYIELAQGNIELYLGKNADILSKIERDFPEGTAVYFVVSFSMEGPVANGITFESKADL